LHRSSRTPSNLAVALLGALWLCGTSWAQSAPQADSAAAFEPIARVLRHPRCLNCHQPDTPLQGDQARVHVPRVIRGPDDKGASAMRCANCHRDANNASSRVPGAPHWQLAPASMDWSGLSDQQLCQMLKDPKRNGNRSLSALVDHMANDLLVRWGWEPGAGRTAVPIPHDAFVELLRAWAAADGACPS
jgi:hypothetical protein